MLFPTCSWKSEKFVGESKCYFCLEVVKSAYKVLYLIILTDLCFDKIKQFEECEDKHWYDFWAVAWSVGKPTDQVGLEPTSYSKDKFINLKDVWKNVNVFTQTEFAEWSLQKRWIR